MKRISAIAILLLLVEISFAQPSTKFAVLVSATIEWNATKKLFPNEKYLTSPWGEYFYKEFENEKVVVFHEGWGKVAAAGATQYVIDQFNPEIVINLGTCGGFEGQIERNEVILADRTIIYDIAEAMGDSKEAIADYTTEIDLRWLGMDYPVKVRKTLLVSADKDLKPDEINFLKKEYHALAGDWESGAIAYTAKRNHKKILILRAVSDLVGTQKGEAYGNINQFAEQSEIIMEKLFKDLPLWIRIIPSKTSK